LGMSPLKGAVLLKKTFLQVKVEVLNHTWFCDRVYTQHYNCYI
jgi:hypothetical protein